MKLNLFCGTDHLHGYINIDIIDAFQPDLLHDLRKPLPFKLESIEEIRIVDGLEHLNYIDAERMMTHWISLLRSHGKILIRVPNQDLVDKNDLKQVFGELNWKGIPTDDFGTHKWGFTKKSLTDWLENLGLQILLTKNELGNIVVEAQRV